MNTYILNCSL